MSVSPDTWRQINEIFGHASELPPEERSAWLDRACAGDEFLRSEVESLLSHARLAEAEIAGSVLEAVDALIEDEPGDSGTRIGPFELVREISRGGMGAVYLANRIGDEFQQNVAIKLVRRGMDSRFVLSRFRHERRILAGLNHPNIARLIDGGATADGRPYFVMEYVEGKQLTSYCRDHGLDITAKLNLFLRICSAVEHAHQHMVIHRDIKPGNILVMANGEPKLLDFGIAKLLDPARTGASLALTSAEMRLLTPEYASPEQVRGEPISAATDVYALGAVLFELLTGEKAHQLREGSPRELERIICLEQTRKPSLVSGDTRLSRRLSGDLDNIVLTAMRKEPERRYQSVSRFADDLQRFLDGRPVLARKDTWFYRAGKFVRRHRIGTVAAVLILAAVAGGTASTVYQARRAERRFLQVRKLANRFLFDFDEKIRNVAGTTEARELLVKTALEYLDSLATEAAGETSLQFELAKAYEKVGDIQGFPGQANLGQTGAAVLSYQKAARIQLAVAEIDVQNQEVLRSVARCYSRLSALHTMLNELPEAEAALLRGRPFAANLLALAKSDPRNYLPSISGSNRLGELQLKKGEPDKALESFRQTVDYCRQRAAVAPGAAADLDTALALQRVAQALEATGDIGGARRSLEEALKLMAPSGKLSAPMRKNLADLHFQIGRLYFNYPLEPGDAAVAERHYRQCLQYSSQLLQADPKDATARYDTANNYTVLAGVVAERAPRESLALHQKAAGIADLLPADSPRRKTLHVSWLLSQGAAQSTAHDRGAARTLQQAVAEFEKLAAASPGVREYRSDLISARLKLGDVLQADDPERALITYQEALKLAESEAARMPGFLPSTTRLSHVYQALGRHFCKVGESSTGQEWHTRQRTAWDEWLRRHPGQPFATAQQREAARDIAACSSASRSNAKSK